MVRDALQTTGWLFSYVTPGPDASALRLTHCHPSIDNTLGLVEEGHAMVMMPTSATEAEAAHWTLEVEEHLRVWDPENPEHDLQTSLSHHIQLIAEVVDAVAKDHATVSHTFQVGVHSLRGETGISNLTQLGEAFALSLR